MSAHVDLQQVLALGMGRLREHHRLTPREGQVCAHIRDCRTPALGGRRLRCARCDYQPVRYHSCRDRHCPRCQGRASAQWAERQRAQALPVTYHHLVFTLPAALNPWVTRHPRGLYDQLYASAWATLSAFAANRKRLGGQGAMSAVLHTWGQTLTRHVHLHCLVPGGVLTGEGQWRAARGSYLYPVRALSRRFRGHFVSGLRTRAQAGELHRVAPGDIDKMLTALMAIEWVVYTKPCLGHTERVIDYLARYTHRIALTDSRLIGVQGDKVGLRYLDYRDARARKTVWLDADELIRRFLLHVLPKGFMRIRNFGFLANHCRAERLRAIRAAIDNAASEPHAEPAIGHTPGLTPPSEPCPRCQLGELRLLALLAPTRDDGG